MGNALRKRRLRIAVAESCTGGLISHRITNVPGSSEYFDRGVIVYSNNSKIQMLGVSQIVLDSYGAVSSETARAMAEGIRSVGGCDIGLAVTGIAGPGGGTADKPVGLVHIGLASKRSTTVSEYRFHGGRREIKEQTASVALGLVLAHLSE